MWRFVPELPLPTGMCIRNTRHDTILNPQRMHPPPTRFRRAVERVSRCIGHCRTPRQGNYIIPARIRQWPLYETDVTERRTGHQCRFFKGTFSPSRLCPQPPYHTLVRLPLSLPPPPVTNPFPSSYFQAFLFASASLFRRQTSLTIGSPSP